MITKMILTNFLSFSDRTEFDFTATKYLFLSESNVNEGILKGAMFIGPNAAGKTNALRGIGFLIRLLKGSGDNFAKYHCTFCRSSILKIEYEFFINEKTINYEITHDAKSNQLSEDLRIEGKTVLTRNGSHGELSTDNYFAENNELDSNTLFLRTASFDTGRFPHDPTLRCLMDFLLNSYYISGYNHITRLGIGVMKFAEENGVQKLNDVLEAFNYGFTLEYDNQSEGEGIKLNMASGEKCLFFKRKEFPFPTSFYIESQGNQVFTDLLPQLISVIENPGMLIIDEFGNSLHNRLAEKIVNYFMNNTNSSQMFINTHGTNLVSNSVFRPDQINLVTFENSNGSKNKRISDFKPREAQNLEKMYLGGMFEGVPNYD